MNTRILQSALILLTPLAFAGFSMKGGASSTFYTFGDCDAKGASSDTYHSSFDTTPATVNDEQVILTTANFISGKV